MTNTNQEPTYRVYVATNPDGSQIMIDVWSTGEVSVAHRPDSWSTWGIPMTAQDMTWEKP